MKWVLVEFKSEYDIEKDIDTCKIIKCLQIFNSKEDAKEAENIFLEISNYENNYMVIPATKINNYI